LSESEDNGGQSNSQNPEDLLKPLPVRKVQASTTKFLVPQHCPLAKVHLFSPNHLRFLEVYTETLDINQALKETGMTRYQVEKSEYLKREIQFINQAAMLKHRAKSAVGRHERLMEKFEGTFDKSGDSKVKSSMASTLARMSEASLRASGEFSEKPDASGVTGVQVVINIGDSSKALESIEGTVIDVKPTE
jgi:hypothetical protein